MSRQPYPSEVDDKTSLFMLPDLLLAPEDSPTRSCPLREVAGAALWSARTGSPWAYLPHDFPPYNIVHQQVLRWFERGCFENMAHDLRMLSREQAGRHALPTVAITDSRTLPSTPENGGRAGYDGAKRRKGSKIHATVDALGHVVTLRVTPGNEQDREPLYDLCREVQRPTGDRVTAMLVDQGYSGE